jgi:UDPglucose 6-dehydrogenase
MRVTMIGAGYVGLVSGACFADFGHQVTVIDKDAKRVAALRDGEIPIFEPGLDDIVNTNVRSGRLEFAADTTRVADADAVFIAVGTPSRRGDGHADLSFVYDAVRQIAPILSSTAVVVTKSTVPVGTGDEIEHILREQRPDAAIEVVSNPEFLREGAAIQDFKHPDRIVVGTDNARARAVLAEVYRSISTPHRSSMSAGAPPS